MFFNKKPGTIERREPAFRILAANLAKDVLAKKLEYMVYLDRIGGYSTGDDDVDEVTDLIEHLPARREFSEKVINEINQIIERLLNS